MKDLKPIRGAALLRRMVAEGEHVTQDFKFAVSDARKIARSISAFANHKGGRLLIGVKDNGVIAGVRNDEDIYVVEQAAERYCNPPQSVSFKSYRLEGAIHVIVAEIGQAESRPVAVVEQGGKLKSYYRVADENIVAHPLMERAWRLASDPELPPLTDRHYALAAIFNEPGTRLDERAIALRMHVTLAEAEALIVRLAAAGLVSFAFDGTRFVPATPEEAEDE